MRHFILFLIFFSHFALAEQESKYQTYLKSPTLENLGGAFAEALSNRDADKASELVDYRALATSVQDLLGEEFNHRFEQGIKKGVKTSLFTIIFNQLDTSKGDVLFRRIINIDNEPRALVMLDYGAEGMNFLELIPERNSKKVKDIYIHVNGSKFTQSMAKAIGMMSNKSSNVVKRLLGMKELDREMVNTFGKIAEYNRNGDFVKSYSLLNTLPQKLKDTRLISAQLTSISQYISDEEYSRQLSQLDRLHGNDPGLSFLLLDHYYETKQYVRAVEGLNRLNLRFGNDSAIVHLIAATELAAGNFVNALLSIDKAIKLEPAKEDLYWFKIEILKSSNNFKQLIVTIDKITETFGTEIDIDFIQSSPDWKSFVESNEFKKRYGNS